MRERCWQRAGRRDLRRSLSWPYEREEQMRAITKSFIIAAIATTAMGANAQSSRTLTREQVIHAVAQVYVHEKACGSKASDSVIKGVQTLAANNGINLNDISAQNDISRIVDVKTTYATRLTPELH